ncbi:class I SAM-dependent methyltransferase [Hydrogenophaga sp.]|uniref:class I SAM-dependent methyltransferase n=1 Tax=Hydrogenophaga sp. TaxID=1904254 RepID=UPI00272362E2|nr:class I SAM-dependent methyltransferase [Hydrogenophaga sp.]MDO8905973.1 class I SAM-dependent methyltransferase [Hydrogenophaga sp.]
MIKQSRSAAQSRFPDRGAALERYRMRAEGYDGELALFEPLRQEAISRLKLRDGESVLDVGCGTGLSFAPLKALVGEQGTIVGIEQCPQMLNKARERVQAHGWHGVRLLSEAADEASLRGQADAAIFHFTHDILRQPEAIAHVMQHLKPGARVVATGLQWAAPWVWPVNLFVWSAAMYSVTTMDGLDKPWSILATFLRDMDVSTTWMGSIFIATGTWSGREHEV